MKTTWVGTRGYRAPELVLKARYSNQADVFALGVCLFVMLCARQPFKIASANDPWYKCIATRQFEKYWRSHKSSNLSDNARKFLQALMCYQPRERVTIAGAYKMDWMDGKMHATKDLPSIMLEKHKKANAEKLKDPERQKRLQQSAPGEKKRGDTSQFRAQVDELGLACPTIEFIPFGAECIELVESNEKYYAADRLQDVIDWCQHVLKASFQTGETPLTTQGTMIATSDSGTSGLQFNLSIAMHDGKMIFLLTFEASDSQNLVPLVSTAVLDALHKSSAFGQYYEPELKVQEVKDHDDFDFSMFDEEDATVADS